ncbi:IS21 family transposase, partial [Bradyrhizobium elkanii]
MVKITGYALSLGKSITIERSVKSPSTPTITPNDAKTREFVTKLETHPEFALSRHQIIKYILTPPGKRSTDVQTLLRLEQVEKARTSLLRVMNDTKKEATRADTDDSRAKQEFFQHLGLRTPSESDLLAALNERRTLLKLEPLHDLAPGASIKAGVTSDKLKCSDCLTLRTPCEGIWNTSPPSSPTICVRIPIYSGRVFRLEAGHRSDLKPAGFLEVGVFVWVSPSGIESRVDQRGQADAGQERTDHATSGLAWPLAGDLTDAVLEQRLFAHAGVRRGFRRHREPDWASLACELKRPGVNLMVLWEEYRAVHPEGYGYSRFCDLFREFDRRLSPTMRQDHPAGDKVFVDYSGKKIMIVDRETGVVRDAEIFVAVLGASSFTYAQATWTQGLADWISAHVGAFAAIGGVPALLGPDNTKVAVIKASLCGHQIFTERFADGILAPSARRTAR